MTPTVTTIGYTGGRLDRGAGVRTDPARLAALRADPGSRVIPVWRDRCPVTGDPAVPVRLTGAGTGLADRDGVFLGLDGTTGIFAVDLSELAEEQAVTLTGADRTLDVRSCVGHLDPAEAAVQAYARGILHWHRNQGFCGTCGAAAGPRDGGALRACTAADCGRLLFPRIEPAVIMLVESAGTPRRCLLARHHGSAVDAYSLLAGFVEIGESLEDAVRREAAEEAGVRVGPVTYQGSQPWPFPAGLMVAFRARALSDEVTVDGAELLDARWFSRAELRDRVAAGHRLGRVDSIDRMLLESWLAGAPA
ncbi:NAD(+) diphosphatase [Micromonospora sp. CPCC 206060]|uniref:NAD(+) diphosphatase n=1 Tax=Micromonospora sp. CPCC 206060 TaxID=3122406 RepID=UPI002FEECB9C